MQNPNQNELDKLLNGASAINLSPQISNLWFVDTEIRKKYKSIAASRSFHLGGTPVYILTDDGFPVYGIKRSPRG